MPCRFRILTILLAGTCALPAAAQDSGLAAIEAKLAAHQAQIERLQTLLAAQSEQIERLTGTSTEPHLQMSVPALPQTSPTATSLTAPTDASVRIPGLDIGGDMRVRREWNMIEGRDRSRSSVRARLRATYKIDDHFAVGTQIATGDPDDPNSTDVTLGNFVDDFQVSLDQAWVRYSNGGFTSYVGKFPQQFQRTDMLWDGDVSPQGVAAAYSANLGKARLDARGLWFVIDEASVARDSDMLGGQLVFSTPLSSNFKAGLTGSYYHYRLGSVAGADAGDLRGNLLSGGRYRSEFHLIEGIGTLNWTGLSPRWPLSFTADYVHNTGAAVTGDTAFNLEFAAGRIAKPGDWRLAYNYSEVEVEAVLAAFSQDNIDLSTNYKLHGIGIGYVPADHLRLDLLWYHYRPLDAAYATGVSPNRWLDRIRLAFMVSF